MKYSFILTLLLAGCGGGGGDSDHRVTVAFYGDSITEGRPVDIAQGDFLVQDFAKAAKTSDAPLDPRDTSSITVLRYGMADAVKGIPPEMTRWNVAMRVAQVLAMGRTPVVVNVNKTESGLEKPTNSALAGLVTVDVSGIQGATVDGVHPTEAFHKALNQKIHDALMGNM